MIGQPNYSMLNKWKKVWVAGFPEKKHWSIIPGQNCLNQLQDEPLHWAMAVAELWKTFENWLCLKCFDHAEWIWRQWVKMFLKTCASEVWEVRKKGSQGNRRTTPDLGERAGHNVRSNVPELGNTTFIVVMCWARNGNNDQPSSNQLQAFYTDMRHWEEWLDFIEKDCCPKEPDCLTAIYKCNLTQEELYKEYIRLYATGQMMNDCLYGQIWYNSSLWNAFKWKLGHNVKFFLEEMKAAAGKDSAEYGIRSAKVIPTSVFMVCYVHR